MALVIESTTETLVGSNDSTPTFNMPATRPDGDLYLLFAVADGSGATTLAVSGWNAPADVAASSSEGTVSIAVLWRIGASEPASYTGTSDSEEFVFYVVRVSGANAADPFDKALAAPGDSAAAIAGGLTSALGTRPANSDGIVFAAWGIDTDDPTYSSGPTGYTRRGSSSSSAGGAGSAYGGLATRDTLTTANVDVPAATMPGTYSDGWATVMLDINVGVAASETVTGVAATATAAVSLPTITALVNDTVAAVAATAPAVAEVPAITAVAIETVAVPAATAPAEVPLPTITAQVVESITGVAATADAAVSTPTITAQVADTVSAVAATAPAVAEVPTITEVQIVSITGVAASADAAVPLPAITGQVTEAITAVAATADATAEAPTISAQVADTAAATPATASATAEAPTISAVQSETVSGELATADAAVSTPTITAQISDTITGVAATADAAIPLPSITGEETGGQTVQAVAAEAPAEVLAPAILAIESYTITVPAASADAEALAPTITALVSDTVTATAAEADAVAEAPLLSSEATDTVLAVPAEADAAVGAPEVTDDATAPPEPEPDGEVGVTFSDFPGRHDPGPLRPRLVRAGETRFVALAVLRVTSLVIQIASATNISLLPVVRSDSRLVTFASASMGWNPRLEAVARLVIPAVGSEYGLRPTMMAGPVLVRLAAPLHIQSASVLMVDSALRYDDDEAVLELIGAGGW